MELSYYFYNHFQTREEIDEFLLQQVKNIIKSEENLRIIRQEESEEGEGDTLDFICNYFVARTTLNYVQETSEEYSINVNFCLQITLYPNGDSKFIQFIGKLLSHSTGDAILLDDYYTKLMERRDSKLLVTDYVFNSDLNVLGVPYMKGIYKMFLLQININDIPGHIIQTLKPEIISIANDCIHEGKVNLVEDPEIHSEFGISWNDFKVNVQKGAPNNNGQVVNLFGSNIYTDLHDPKLKLLIKFFREIIVRFQGDFKFSVTRPYRIANNKELLANRLDGNININEDAEEHTLLYEIGF